MPFIFIVFPFIELWCLIVFGAKIGATNTILWIILSAIIGGNFMRMLGFQHLNQQRRHWGQADVDDSVIDLLARGLAAIMLIIPGFISDAIGIVMLIPALRRLILKALFATVISRKRTSTKHRTIEGEFRRED